MEGEGRELIMRGWSGNWKRCEGTNIGRMGGCRNGLKWRERT